MVFQNPHGRLHYSSMLLDRDIAYFNFILLKVDCVYPQVFHTMLPHNTKAILIPVSFQVLKHKHMFDMSLKIKSV